MGAKTYIYQQENWPDFTWQPDEILELLADVRNKQGRLLGKMSVLGFDLQNEAFLETFTSDIVHTNEIEGIVLSREDVRSSVAKKLGLDAGGLPPVNRYVEGIVDMMFDAVNHFDKPLTKERLFDWHAALFPQGRSGVFKIVTADWRKDKKGRMQVVSGAIGKETVHFVAPPASRVEEEMQVFLDWLNGNNEIDAVLKAAIAHLWFVTIHPFEDGNGRMARAITDMLLARADGFTQRFYSMSSQILRDRKDYYEILEQTQKGGLDITRWLIWFLQTLKKAVMYSDEVLDSVINKHRFWNKNALLIKNERQKKVLNKLLSGFTGNLTTKKWAKITKCSHDTALRDIQDLINKGILEKSEAGGRSTNYVLREF